MTRDTKPRRDRAGCGTPRPARERVGFSGALVSLLSVVALLIRVVSWAADRNLRPAGPRVAPERELDDGGDRIPAAGAREECVSQVRPKTQPRARGLAPRRLGGAFVFAALFFGGAALAAVAGDGVGSVVGDVPEDVPPVSTCADPAAIPPGDAAEVPEAQEACPEAPVTPTEPPTEVPPADPEPAEPPASEEPGAPSAPPAAPPADGGEAAPPVPPPAAGPAVPAAGGGATKTRPKGPAPATAASAGGSRDGDASGGRAVTPLVDEVRPHGAPTAVDPEAARSGGVVWLHRALPDPISRTERLSPRFARRLQAVSRRAGVSWTLVLGVVRAKGRNGSAPAGTAELREIAERLSAASGETRARRPWLAALAYSGRTAFADRAVALSRLHRAVGLHGLVRGLQAAKRTLVRRVLADEKIEIYAAGRADVEAGRINVRVLVLLRYLRFAHGGVTVSSLASGHRVFARPGVVSAHVYGLAVDIAALGGVPIVGHQEPHGLTERAVRNILLLPPELAPQQVISLLALGGPSFAAADHADHIHVGY